LRHVVRKPGLLHRGQRAALGQSFDGDDLLAFGAAHRERAGAYRLAVDVTGAGAALGNAATVLGAGEAAHSRIAHNSGVSGSMSIVCASPLMVSWAICPSLKITVFPAYSGNPCFALMNEPSSNQPRV
jgi:hypothetical protein